MQTTGNLGLKKPEGTDIVDIADLNGNMDILDNAVNSKVDKVTGKQLSTNDYTAVEKTKLAGIAAGATNYTHPATHPPAIIAQDASNRFVTDAEKTAWNAKAGTAVATTSTNGLMSAVDKTLLNNNTGFGTTAGTGTAYTVTLSPTPTALVAGLRFSFISHIASGANPTLNANALGAKAIKKSNGNAATLALNGVYTVVYNGSAFILQGEGGEYGTANAADVLATATIGTENGIVTGTVKLKTTANGVTGGSAGVMDYHDAVASIGPAAHNDTSGAIFMQILPTGENRIAVDRGVFFRAKEPNINAANWLQGKPIFGMDGAIPQRGNDQMSVAFWTNGQGNVSIGFPTGAYLVDSGFGAGIASTTVNSDAFRPENIRAGIPLGNITGTLQPSTSSAVSLMGKGGSGNGTFEVATLPAGANYASSASALRCYTGSQSGSGNKLLLFITNTAGQRVNLASAYGQGSSTTYEFCGFYFDRPQRKLLTKMAGQQTGYGDGKGGWLSNAVDGQLAMLDWGVLPPEFDASGQLSIYATISDAFGPGYASATISGYMIYF
jgi:hypothetical protein